MENKFFDTLNNIVKFIFDAIVKLCHFITNGFKMLYNFIIFLFRQIRNKIKILDRIKNKSKENQEPYKRIENLTVKIHDWKNKHYLFEPFNIWRDKEVERLNTFINSFEITEKEGLETIKQISKEITSNDLLFVDHSTIEYAYKDKNANKEYFSKMFYKYIENKFGKDKVENFYSIIKQSKIEKGVYSFAALETAYEESLKLLLGETKGDSDYLQEPDTLIKDLDINFANFYFRDGNTEIVEWSLRDILNEDKSPDNIRLIKNYEKIIDEKQKEYESYDIPYLNKISENSYKAIKTLEKECNIWADKVRKGEKINQDEYHRLLNTKRDTVDRIVGEIETINMMESYKANIIRVFLKVVKESAKYFSYLSEDCFNITNKLTEHDVII